jgi:hypothetical protein
MSNTKTPICGNINENMAIDVLHIHTEKMQKSENKTYHEYIEQAPVEIKTAFDIIKTGKILKRISHFYPGCIVESIDGMNEIYITAIGSVGSDRVFETEHLDGPFFFFPFCTVLRCILAVRGNKGIVTEFPATCKSIVLDTNEFVAFDYNRDSHYIWKDMNVDDNSRRIILKLHYLVVYQFVPRPIVNLYKKVHTRYNQFMRRLFLESQKETVLASVVNNGTKVYCLLYKKIALFTIAAAGGILLFMICK